MIFLLIIAAVIRLASCNKYMFMDECAIFQNISNFFATKSLMPAHFNYTTLFSYLSTIPTGLGAIVLYLQDTIPSLKDVAYLYHFRSILPILPARFVSVFLGVSTLWILFKIGERFFSKKTGLIAAALLGFSNLHIHYSGYALPEVTMTFFATCSILFSLYSLETRSMKNYIIAGIFAGLTASTKYNGALIFIPIIMVHLFHLYDEKNIYSPRAWFDKRIIFSVLSFACAFLAGSPGWFLSPRSYLDALLFEQAHMDTGHMGNFGMLYVQHIILFWRYEKIIAVLFGLGLLYGIFRLDRKKSLLVALILPSFLYIGSWTNKSLHYLIFLYPALTLLSAAFLSSIFSKLGKFQSNTGALFLMIAIFTWPICSSFSYAYNQLLEDNRWIAYRWIQSNIPARSTIIVDWAYLPILFSKKKKNDKFKNSPQEFYQTYLENMRTYILIPLKYNPMWISQIQADYFITSSICFDRFFKTPPPAPGNPKFDDYNKRKKTYAALFTKRKELGWESPIRFYEGKGPEILIYKKRVSGTNSLNILEKE